MLSVAMIVRDAADLLPATLDSFRAIADEFVVLDTGSGDDTVRLAHEGGATVFETAWRDDFSSARNECAQHVSGEWTLWIDAGETIDNAAGQQLRRFVETRATPSKAYVLYLQRPSAGGDHASAEQIGQLRLLPTVAEVTFVGRVRETSLPAAIAAGLEIDALECLIQRPACDADPQTRTAKAERNLRLVELAIADGGETPVLLNVRAQALVELGRGDEAADAFRQAIESAPRGSTEMLEAYYGLLSYLDGSEQHRQLRMNTCLEALEVYPLDAQLLCGMGCYLLQEQRLELAARSYELAATHGQVDPGTWHLTDLAEVAVACQSLLCQLLGDDAKSRSVLESALEDSPDSERLRRQLIDVYIKSCSEAEALAELDELSDEVPHRNELEEAVRGAVLVSSGKAHQALPRLRSAYESGCRDRLCFRWLTTAYLQLGDLDAAEQLLNEWQARDPTSSEIVSCRLALAGARRRNAQERASRVDRPGPRARWSHAPRLEAGSIDSQFPYPPASV